MRTFTQSAEATLSTTAEVTLLTVVGGAAVIVGVYDFVVGCYATPADQTAQWELRRFSAGGTPQTTPTPIKTNPQSQAAAAATNGSANGTAFSVEPTYTDVLLKLPVHQRGIGRFWAFEGRELYSTATAGHGIGAVSKDATAAYLAQGSVFWRES